MVHLDPSYQGEVQTAELVAAADFSFCLAILVSIMCKDEVYFSILSPIHLPGHGVQVFAAADTVPVNACQGLPSPS